jgi:hypothetical protein
VVAAYPNVSPLESKIVPGRSCGSCTLCCKVFAVPEVESPRSVLCKHCVPEKGCSIHASRPPVCREFFCNWLLVETLGPEWQPERSRIVLQSVALAGGHQGLSIHADPDFPENWRLPPYYSQIKAWAAKAAQHTKQTGPIYFVVAEIELRNFLILPDRDVDLGIFQDKEIMEIERQARNGQIEITARKARSAARQSSFSQSGAHISLRLRDMQH